MKKSLLYILLFILLAFFAYITFVIFIISGDTEDKEKYCSQYITPLNLYKSKHSLYPTLDEAKKLNLNFELSLDDCSYGTTKNQKEFFLHVSEGLSVAGYDSNRSKWWHD